MMAAALWPTARVSHLGVVAITVGLAAIPTAVTMARGNPTLSSPLILAFLVCGSALGWALEDPVADLFGSLPLSSPRRTLMRVLLASVVAALGLAIVLTLLASGPGVPLTWVDHFPEAAAAGAVALAVGASAVRRGERATGPIAVTAGPLSAVLVAALAFRFPRMLPTFNASPVHTRWWVLAIVACAVTAWSARDPGRR